MTIIVGFLQALTLFWVVHNSKPIIGAMHGVNKRSKATSVSTLDFSTLYTKLPHNKLLMVRNSLIDFCFDGGKIKYITVKGALSGLRQFLTTENPFKMMKNVFYFTSKALFVLKISKFLS